MSSFIRISRWLVLPLLLFSTVGGATPAEVVILRHAEKPATGPHLSDRGYERAKALVGFFTTRPEMKRLGDPAGIYAGSPASSDGSVRSIETIAPTAQAFNLNLNQQFNKNMIPDLVHEILTSPVYDGRMVIICWPHDSIPEIASQLGANSAPSTWDKQVFDRVWVLDFSNGRVSAFQSLPQNILSGDSSR